MSQHLYDRLIREESWENELYKDSKGIYTIGVGYNIQERGLPDHVIQELFRQDYLQCQREAKSLVRNWDSLGQVRQSVLSAMVFQMGLSRVRLFKKMLSAVESGDFELAGEEMLDSKWAREDSPARARREARMMVSGQYN